MLGYKIIDSDHNDLIHDVRYDYYGKRMVTCSSDHIIKVWELTDDKEWACISKLQGHHGSVWKVAWAHPEYGQVVASCGFDRTISIWEEISSNNQPNSHVCTKSEWVRRTQLVDSRNPVTDIKFAPRHLGLQLASCSTDGMIRLYEAQDVMDLSQWTLKHDFSSQKSTTSCLSWSQSSAFSTLLGIGICNSAAENKVLLYEMLDYKQNWNMVQSIDKVEGTIHDISFAPCMGQSFHTLAVAADQLYIFYITPNSNLSGLDDEGSDSTNSSRYFIKQAQIITTNQTCSKVWRVSWNVTGTLLAASGEDGYVRLLRRNYIRVWHEETIINGPGLVGGPPSLQGPPVQFRKIGGPVTIAPGNTVQGVVGLSK